MNLSPISIPANVNIDGAKTMIEQIVGDSLGQQDHSCARAHCRPVVHEPGEVLGQAFNVKKPAHGRRFPAGDNQGIDTLQFSDGLDQPVRYAEPFQCPAVEIKGPLQGQNTDCHMPGHDFNA